MTHAEMQLIYDHRNAMTRARGMGWTLTAQMDGSDVVLVLADSAGEMRYHAETPREASAYMTAWQVASALEASTARDPNACAHGASLAIRCVRCAADGGTGEAVVRSRGPDSESEWSNADIWRAALSNFNFIKGRAVVGKRRDALENAGWMNSPLEDCRWAHPDYPGVSVSWTGGDPEAVAR